ncbi:MAG: hypothetical protein IIY91_00670, partial [Selenomonas sp.]|nr:hypothetical protein [Selenomonas sp.]
AKLFDTLRAADESYASRKDEVGFQGMRVIIDDEGEVTMESSKRPDYQYADINSPKATRSCVVFVCCDIGSR